MARKKIYIKSEVHNGKTEIVYFVVKTFNLLISIFPIICSNIPAAPANGVYISQLKRYPRACCSYQDFLDRKLLLIMKLPNQGFLLVKLKSSLRKFCDRHHDLVNHYTIYVSQMTMNIFHMS